MLPCAAVQVLCWLAAAHWLRRDTGNPVRWLPWLGLVAGAFLGLYVAFLGTGGGIYGVLRAYGVTVYFGVTYLALLRSEEHTSELQSLMRISYAVFCLKKKKTLQ